MTELKDWFDSKMVQNGWRDPDYVRDAQKIREALSQFEFSKRNQNKLTCSTSATALTLNSRFESFMVQ